MSYMYETLIRNLIIYMVTNKLLIRKLPTLCGFRSTGSGRILEELGEGKLWSEYVALKGSLFNKPKIWKKTITIEETPYTEKYLFCVLRDNAMLEPRHFNCNLQVTYTRIT